MLHDQICREVIEELYDFRCFERDSALQSAKEAEIWLSIACEEKVTELCIQKAERISVSVVGSFLNRNPKVFQTPFENSSFVVKKIFIRVLVFLPFNEGVRGFSLFGDILSVNNRTF